MKKMKTLLLCIMILATTNLAYGLDLPNTRETIIDIGNIDTDEAQLIRFHIGSDFVVDTCNRHELMGETLPLEYGLDEVSIIIEVKTNGRFNSTGMACMDSRLVRQFLSFETYESKIYPTKIKFVHPRGFKVKYSLVYESELIDP